MPEISGLLILAYHNIGEAWCMPSAGPDGVTVFAEQMNQLLRSVEIVPLESALYSLFAGRPLPDRAVSITFDDGYRDILDLAAPILANRNIQSTAFLVPGFLSGNAEAWWERLGRAIRCARASYVDFGEQRLPLHGAQDRMRTVRTVEESVKALNHKARVAVVEDLVHQANPAGEYAHADLFLDWQGARELVARGVAIGSHTLDHCILAREDDAHQCSCLARSRRLLHDELNVPAEMVAFPSGQRGDYSTRLLHFVASWAGVTVAEAAGT